jgi:hypothetical protein
MLAAAVIDRRRFPRVQADILFRPAGLSLFHHRRSPKDIGLGGARILSDEALDIGQRLDLEVLLPDGSSVRCWAEVVWVARQEADAPAPFEVGLKFTDLAPEDVQRLASALGGPG